MNNSLIPRRVLFGNPERSVVRLSHDGKYLSYLAPVNGVQNVWVAPVENSDAAKPITNATERGIPWLWWTYSNEYILYVQDRAGDENYRIYCVNIHTLEERDLTPLEGFGLCQKGLARIFQMRSWLA
jgi:Tol biopolymer transport system component